MPCKFINLAIGHINEEIVHLSEWGGPQGFDFNEKKFKAMILGSDQNLEACAKMNLPPIQVNGEIIPLVTKAKSLGVVLSTDLSWNAHLSGLSSRVHNVLHKLRFRGWLLSRELKIMLIQSLVLPHIDYACLVYNDLKEYLNLKVQRLAHAGIRFIFNLRKDASITNYRKQLGWLKVENRRKYFLMCQLFNIKRSKRPKFFFESFASLHGNVRRSNRLGFANVIVPNCRTLTYKNSFYISGAELLHSQKSLFSINSKEKFQEIALLLLKNNE